jgi:hypothetical protein
MATVINEYAFSRSRLCSHVFSFNSFLFSVLSLNNTSSRSATGLSQAEQAFFNPTVCGLPTNVLSLSLLFAEQTR